MPRAQSFISRLIILIKAQRRRCKNNQMPERECPMTLSSVQVRTAVSLQYTSGIIMLFFLCCAFRYEKVLKLGSMDQVYFSSRRSTVDRLPTDASVDCRPTHRPTVGRQSVDSRPTVGRRSADC